MPTLELDRLAMSYGPRALFHGLSATVTGGETLVVTGTNGAGKSTLLKIIAGLARPEEGCVRFDGELPTDRRRALGYAAPDTQLYAELTGDENLEFFRRLRGLPPEAITGLLKRVGLSPSRGSDRVSEYSSGMRQRLKLAASLLGAPPLLVWDEPTATLDARGVGLVEDILDAQRRRGGITVLATNDADEAGRWADQRVQIGR
ncbi:MAG: heme ABC exporter ATP-binding protein CcmA [Armatimonadota bacterium]|nr:heme ABC exporter ATP-binding protein CcmA [Armatimonadota bacterium]